MTVLLTIIHVVVALSLILIVLLQGGKGADMGAAFGGASQTIFGTSGAATFLGRLTTIAAIIFMITSLSLTAISRSRTTSVMPDTPKATQTIPVQPTAERAPDAVTLQQPAAAVPETQSPTK